MRMLVSVSVRERRRAPRLLLNCSVRHLLLLLEGRSHRSDGGDRRRRRGARAELEQHRTAVAEEAVEGPRGRVRNERVPQVVGGAHHQRAARRPLAGHVTLGQRARRPHLVALVLALALVRATQPQRARLRRCSRLHAGGIGIDCLLLQRSLLSSACENVCERAWLKQRAIAIRTQDVEFYNTMRTEEQYGYNNGRVLHIVNQTIVKSQSADTQMHK